MRRKQELDVDFIGGERALTEEDKAAFSAFFRAYKRKHLRKQAVPKPKRATTARKKIAA